MTGSLDPAVVRAAHRTFPTGVTVVTTMAHDQPKGLAVNAFCSVSLEPPTVLVCVSRASRSCEALVRATSIGINLLAADQEPVARTFAGRENDKFAHLEWRLGACGAPLLDGASAHFEVRPTTIALAATHFVLIGEVVSCDASDRPPLVYLDGKFFDSTGWLPASPAGTPSSCGGSSDPFPGDRGSTAEKGAP
ncbi:MAG: flavin reductase family protein [Actinobacteria bacterium]|nr:flavin reductase family protein [Actinomycetota bacterium]